MRLILALVFGLACTGQDGKLPFDQVVPDFAIKDLKGTEIKLSDFRKSDKSEGKVVLVVFWSYKCPDGKAILADVKEVAKKCGQDIVLVPICAYGETEEQLRKHHADNALEYPLYFDVDKKGAKLFGAKVATVSYVLDREGKLVYRGSYQKAFEAAANAAQGKKIEERETKPKG